MSATYDAKPLTLGQIKAQRDAERKEAAEERKRQRQIERATARLRGTPANAANTEQNVPRDVPQEANEAVEALFPTPTPHVTSPTDANTPAEALAEPYTPPEFDFDRAVADPLQELAQRELCRRRLLPFIQRFRPKYTAGWVHKDICRRLERFVEQVERGEAPRLLLMMPVRHGKSEICSRHLPPWMLGKHPDWEVIAASGAQSLAMSFSRYGRDLIQNPAYGAIFPDTCLDPSSKSVENWNLTKGGGYLSAGIGTMITGRGCHVLVIDDPVRDGEASDSPTIRDNVWEWYMSTAYTRLAPGGGVLGVLTWWNEDDWAGRIQQVMATGDGDRFEIVRYPAINDIGDEYLLPDDSIEQLPPEAPVPEGARLLRRVNTALHPERFSSEELLKKKANYCALGQKRWWDALFQQNPTPEDGDYFTPDMFRYYSTPPSRGELMIYQAWDFAITEDQKRDYTVGTTIGVDSRGAIYVLDVARFRSSDGIIIANTIVDYARQWDPYTIGVEDGQIWKTMASQFTRACEEARFFPSYQVLQPLTAKFVRASPLKGQMQGGRVYFDKNARWFTELYKEFLRFGAGGLHDDMVDSLSWAVRLTLLHAPPRPKDTQPKLPSWKDALLGGDSYGASHMAA